MNNAIPVKQSHLISHCNCMLGISSILVENWHAIVIVGRIERITSSTFSAWLKMNRRNFLQQNFQRQMKYYFVIIVNGFQTLTLLTKRSILDVAAVLDPLLIFFLQGKLIDITIACMKVSFFTTFCFIEISRKSFDWLPNKTTVKRLYLILIF